MSAETQATHTPGPWIVEVPDNTEEPRANIRAPRADYELVAVVDTRPDAALIAAAPELLAACEAAESLLRECSPAIRIGFDYTNLCSVSRDPDELADQLRAAVAKARGQAS